VIFLLLPLFGILAGLGATLMLRRHPRAAAAGAAIIPAVLLYMFAIYRVGLQIISHPGLWMLAIMWAVFVAAGHFLARFVAGRK
jgi:hypothetical protein